LGCAGQPGNTVTDPPSHLAMNRFDQN
jgi:hypothetical protein